MYDYCVARAAGGDKDVYEWISGEAASADQDFELALRKWTYRCRDLQADEDLACGLVGGIQLIFSDRDLGQCMEICDALPVENWTDHHRRRAQDRIPEQLTNRQSHGYTIARRILLFWRRTELTAIPDMCWTYFLVKIQDRLSVVAMTLNSYYAQGEEEQLVPEEVVAQCLIAWSSVN